MGRAPLTDNARRYRRTMWLVALGAVPTLVLTVWGAIGRIPFALGIVAAVLFFVCIGTAARLGLKMHRQALADREMQARRAMIVMMAATLGKQEDEALERIEAKGGISGEAAGMILSNRRTKRNES